MSAPTFGIRGTGSWLPDQVLDNEALTRMVDTSDEWITQRTGIRERRILPEGLSTSDMCREAARRALDDAGICASELDLIILATVTPDQHVPATSCKVAADLGCEGTPAFDLAAGCSGFVYAMSVASQFFLAGTAKNVLVIGAEALSRITNYQDRTSCILFGDAAGAVVLSTEYTYGQVLSTTMAADGTGYDVMYQRAGGAKLALTPELLEQRADKLVIHGREIYRFAVSRMVELVQGEQAKNPDLELAAVIPHQVNMRIIESAREKLGLPKERLYVNIDRYGNTSAASIPVALDEARRSGFFDDLSGKLVVMCAFGAGLTWGSVAVKW